MSIGSVKFFIFLKGSCAEKGVPSIIDGVSEIFYEATYFPFSRHLNEISAKDFVSSI